MIKRKDIQIRDPFVYAEDKTYYLYGTTDSDPWRGPAEGFSVYTSRDLVNFDLPVQVFSAQASFWGRENFWAPELHRYQGAFYLFASFKAPGRRRATSILKADSPFGPFLPWGEETVTPPEWECLDGTLHTDPAGRPWLVFCHEWVQFGGGTICARRLKSDLSGADGEPLLLLKASDAKWAKKIRHSSGVEGHVTDGPFVYRGKERLWLLWSSLAQEGYAAGLSYSPSGEVTGPWVNMDGPLYHGDGGHGMLFKDTHGVLTLAVHAPNKTPMERPQFLRARDEGDKISLSGEVSP